MRSRRGSGLGWAELRRKRRRTGTQEDRRIDGIVEEILPGALYRVRTSDGREICASLERLSRHGIVRLIVGNRVELTVTANDPHRGRITAKV